MLYGEIIRLRLPSVGQWQGMGQRSACSLLGKYLFVFICLFRKCIISELLKSYVITSN